MSGKRVVFLPVAGGEWVQPIRKGYRMACCDCGLVHSMDFRVKGGRPQFRVRRDFASTRYLRKRDAKLKAATASGGVDLTRGEHE